ncbi:unnamed protein product [Albugo candida]|uniref:Uncharacterized protein n=1 Tax=Albugo candida TaxID=65357 RepID=A0A024FSS1_9STRA|nr:unnamed protein product [Albugo candida]|eukprot:CCI10033.1 unnamed protein product [Albugo candida]
MKVRKIHLCGFHVEFELVIAHPCSNFLPEQYRNRAQLLASRCNSIYCNVMCGHWSSSDRIHLVNFLLAFPMMDYKAMWFTIGAPLLCTCTRRVSTCLRCIALETNNPLKLSIALKHLYLVSESLMLSKFDQGFHTKQTNLKYVCFILCDISSSAAASCLGNKIDLC